MPVWEKPKVIVSQQYLFKKFFWYESFRYVSTLREKFFFSGTSQVFFSLVLKLLRFCSFRESQFVIDRRSQFENNRFFKSSFIMKFFSRDLFSVKKYLLRQICHLSFGIGCFLSILNILIIFFRISN